MIGIVAAVSMQGCLLVELPSLVICPMLHLPRSTLLFRRNHAPKSSYHRVGTGRNWVTVIHRPNVWTLEAGHCLLRRYLQSNNNAQRLQ